MVLIYSLKSDVLCFALNILNTTSADVIPEPSENLASSLKVKIQVFGSVATDPNTWIFTLREDAKFSDGSGMTSADVVFSILRAKQRTSDFKEYISTISNVEAVGDYAVKITTSKPNPILLNQLV